MNPLRPFITAGLLLALAACQAPVRTSPPTADAEAAAPAVAKPATDGHARATPAAANALITPAPLPDTVRGEEVFARLVARLADSPCPQDRVVQRWEQMYGRWAPRFRSRMEEILPLLAFVLDELEVHGLPAEFALLPIVESWYRPEAGSARTAYGMWQFTAGTARNNGLRVEAGLDERLAPHAATRAAMRHLSMLHNRFGDWKLADMAFNAGEYRLQRVLERAGAGPVVVSPERHLPAGLSMITYEHVAKIQALVCLIARPDRFGIELPYEHVVPALQMAELPAGINTLDAAATLAQVDAAELRALNPVFRHGRIAVNARRQLLLPRAAARRLAEAPAALAQDTPHAGAIAEAAEPAATATPASAAVRTHRVVRGDTLGGIARRRGVTLRQLLEWNGLDVRALLHPGQMLRLEP